MDGVAKAEVSISDRTVDVEYDPETVELDAIVTAIDDQGYEVEGH